MDEKSHMEKASSLESAPLHRVGLSWVKTNVENLLGDDGAS